jgi:hypothetical protein
VPFAGGGRTPAIRAAPMANHGVKTPITPSFGWRGAKAWMRELGGTLKGWCLSLEDGVASDALFCAPAHRSPILRQLAVPMCCLTPTNTFPDSQR